MKTSTIRPERFYLLHEKMLREEGNIVRSDSDRIHYQEMLAADVRKISFSKLDTKITLKLSLQFIVLKCF